MRKKLFAWLDKTDAVKAEKNEMFIQSKADSIYLWRSTEFKAKLEKKRLDMLKKDWEPNKNWWGSKITID